MDGTPLLPGRGLPRTRFPKGEEVAWLSTDSLENFQRRGHPLYGPDDIRYRFNRLGYRCDEFDAPAAIRIVAIGCSYVMGVGLPQEALFHERFGRRLQAATSQAVVVWNLGLPAASNDYICRLLYLAVPWLDPHLVLINFTHASRREYVTLQEQWVPYAASLQPPDAVIQEVYDHFKALSSPYDDELNFFRNYKAVESLLTDRFWLYSLSRPAEIARIMCHLDASRYVGALGELDRARDGRHPGPASHEKLSELYWDRFCQRDGMRQFCAARA